MGFPGNGGGPIPSPLPSTGLRTPDAALCRDWRAGRTGGSRIASLSDGAGAAASMAPAVGAGAIVSTPPSGVSKRQMTGKRCRRYPRPPKTSKQHATWSSAACFGYQINLVVIAYFLKTAASPCLVVRTNLSTKRSSVETKVRQAVANASTCVTDAIW